MNFTKTTSYSLSILNYMAKNPDVRVSAEFLHSALNIPYQYLRQVLSALSRGGFILGTKGRNGGFLLNRQPDQIFLADIVYHSEGEDILKRCVMNFTVCPFNNVCPLHDLWKASRENMIDVLERTSLSDLIKISS